MPRRSTHPGRAWSAALVLLLAGLLGCSAEEAGSSAVWLPDGGEVGAPEDATTLDRGLPAAADVARPADSSVAPEDAGAALPDRPEPTPRDLEPPPDLTPDPPDLVAPPDLTQPDPPDLTQPDPPDQALPDAGPPAPDLAVVPTDAGSPTPDAGADPDAGQPPLTGCIRGEFTPFWGNQHAHTDYSDGEGTPAEAFSYARDQGHLDFQIISDHLEQLWLPPTKWDRCLEQADEAYEPELFLADCAFEYGQNFEAFASIGHNNVFVTRQLFPILQFDFREFYRLLVNCPECIGQFNHPGDDPTQTWHDFVYDPEADARLRLFEFNGAGPTWELYFQALDQGWHVSPTYNQDNHSADWGTDDDNRTGYFLTGLNREALYQAMLERRSFATTDRNAWIRLLGQGDCWMGSRLGGVAVLQVDVELQDADPADGFAAVEFYGPGRQLLATLPCDGQPTCRVSWSLAVPGPTYLVARGVQQDGNYLVAAPLWVAP